MDPSLIKGCQTPEDILLRMSGASDMYVALFHFRAAIEQGANPNAIDAQGKTALMKVCASPGHYALEFIQALLEKGAKVPPDLYLLEEMALSELAPEKMAAAIRLLAQAGVPITAKGSEGESLVMLACVNPSLEKVQTLLDLGVDPLDPGLFGQTALHILGPSEDAQAPAVLRLLLKVGLDPLAPDNEGDTPLDHATLALRAIMEEHILAEQVPTTDKARLRL